MHKGYIICFIFLFTLIVFSVSYFYFKNNSVSEIPIEEQTEQIMISEIKDTNFSVIKITNLTQLKLQIMDMNNDTFEEVEINTPVEFLEMGRENLIDYLKEYLDNPSSEDKRRGLISFELIKFSSEEVVLRKTFEREMFNVRIENGYLVIVDDYGNIYDYTEISENSLPENVKKQIDEGLYFLNIEDLYKFLESYSS